ncbi:MAG: amidohydrolase [Rhodospirillales bacterium 70-18]|mgnify:FL=1|nr:MAG: amidohydrolase [Rhodospirillales bacterium 70-18]
MTQDVIDAIRPYQDELVAIRRDIHAHPETRFEEVRTAALVADKLREWGIEVHTGLGKTGVVGTLRGTKTVPSGNSQRSVGLRADMDALFIEEQTGLPYASQVAGKMHACGHDGHTTMLLGAARYLSEHRDFAGTVHFIFQPAEEGGHGAREMIKDGLFERFPCDAVYGMHAIPGFDAGAFAITSGAMMAASDSFTARFRGTGGHGSAPDKGTDPSMAMAHFILGTQGIVGRNVSGLDSAVISVGHVAGGAWGSPNIIPAEMVVRGTVRSYTPEVRDLLERRLVELAHGIGLAQGVEGVCEYVRGYPATVNHPAQTTLAVAAATEVAGVARVDAGMTPVMGSEDFAYMLEARPGAYIFLGNGKGPYVHTPLYNFNDEVIPAGVSWWVAVTRRELEQGQE